MRRNAIGLSLLSIVLGLVLTVTASPSAAFTKNFRWSAVSTGGYVPDTQFPVLRLFICQNRFQEDLGFAAVDVVRQATLAMNAWFTYRNIHLRMRYAGDLAATDPLCAEWGAPRPPNGDQRGHLNRELRF